jgi:hypothetical protein
MNKPFGKRLPPREAPIIKQARIPSIALSILAIGVVAVAISMLALSKPSPRVSDTTPQQPSATGLDEHSTGTPNQAIYAGATPTFPVINPITHCKARYPLDYEMRDVCIRNQDEAKLTANTIRIDDDVRVLCAERYPHDWSMYLVCSKKQMSAKLSDEEKPDRPDFDIVTKCREEWPRNYRMEEHCIGKQEEARDQAASPTIDDEIAIRCTSEWPSDWQMFIHCVEQQTDAKLRVR